VPAVEAEHTVLVTGAGGPIGVNLTRSLRLCSRPLRLVGTDANPYHRPLALTDVCLPVPRAGAEGYLERINAIIAEHGVELVVPTHPVEVRALSVLRDQVQAKLFLPPHQAILNGQDKMRSHQLFTEAGVPVPRTLAIREPADVQRAFDELVPPPIWFRGSGVPGAGIGVASLPCRSVGVARAWVEHHQGWGRMMASEFLPGDNLTWLGVWHEGVLWASQSRQRLEYVIPHVSPSGVTGAPAVAHTVRREDVRRAGEDAVRAICPGPPHGIFFVDLKADTAGVARVTEVNAGRFGTTLHFYTAAGFNFPELALDLALGRLPGAPVHDPLPPDTYWIRTLDCGPVLLPGSALDTE
jgi:carbamoyl-phosphate synthase large subunit